MKKALVKTWLNVRSEPKLGSFYIKRVAAPNETIEVTDTEVFQSGYVWVQLVDGTWTAKKWLEFLPENNFKPTPPIVKGNAKDITDKNLFVKDLDATGFNTKENNLVLKAFSVISHLDIENPKHALQPIASATYCNIYAYQYNRLMFSHLTEDKKPFLPRVWWTDAALELLEKGFDLPIKLSYRKEDLKDNTVFELNANGLHKWFKEWGFVYGWTVKSYTKGEIDMHDVQKMVNAGKVAYIIGKRKDLSRSGHITAVVPEVGNYKYTDELGVVQTQAGVNNFKIFTASYYTRIWYNYTMYDDVIVVYQ